MRLPWYPPLAGVFFELRFVPVSSVHIFKLSKCPMIKFSISSFLHFRTH